MDALQEYQGSHLITVTIDGASRPEDMPHDFPAAIDTLDAHLNRTKNKDVRPEDDIERFHISYIHPDFPVHTVTYATAKRIFDVCFSILLCIFSSPIMLVTAILVKCTSPGPIIFRQTRVGRGGRYFTCYKFRSMCIDAEARKAQLYHLNEVDGPVFKIKRDPRLTPIGAIIRKLSIDELPQLFNVLVGDMSIVGPRPPVPTEVARYGAYERGRLAVLPGLTCLWQIGGRSKLSFEKWVQLDRQYIETMSFAQDFIIVLKTVPAVLFGWGAH